MSFYDVMLSPPYQVKVSEAESGYVHLTVWKKLDQTYELTSIELNKTAEDQLWTEVIYVER